MLHWAEWAGSAGTAGGAGTKRTSGPAHPADPACPARSVLMIIAIDGPSGAGKGTVARAVARELGYRHVDSGAMYRAVGWKALDQGIDLQDEEAVGHLAGTSSIELTAASVAIDGVDVTRAIRTPAIDKAAT